MTLPDDVKKAVGFAPGALRSARQLRAAGARRPTAAARASGRWSWSTQVLTTADLYVLPSPVFLRPPRSSPAPQAAAATVATATFEQKSDLAIADCGEERRGRGRRAAAGGREGRRSAPATGSTPPARSKIASRCVRRERRGARARANSSAARESARRTSSAPAPISAQGLLAANGQLSGRGAGARGEGRAEPAPLTFPAGGVAEGRIDRAATGASCAMSGSASRAAPARRRSTRSISTSATIPQGQAAGVSKTGRVPRDVQRRRLTRRRGRRARRRCRQNARDR